ncbi:hypothetical protein BDZ89DRAFT_1015180 [Hymenopellis radicata]|nr:hypothetical protein BDZ89DRAFT_1015180 [Hymenopellis radicata]
MNHSACGYDHVDAQSKTRHVPSPFTGCLAHVEVTVLVATQQILRIRGYLNHNDACKTAHFTRIPPIPVHPSVYSLALKHLAAGATLADVHKQNRAMFQSYGYAEMPRDSAQWKHRWLLLPKDSRSLYRQFSRWKGVRTKEKAHINVDEWLDPASPRFNKTLADAVFHYSARASKGERFEACIATKDMKEAAWKYCHQSQIMVDGTFGICEKKVLLFVVMGIDQEGHGIPVAFLLFSAPTGNSHTAAGYDTAILAKLLQKWKQSLEDFAGKPFSPSVAITDTDLKERGALLRVFPHIFLLICRVHLRRSWKNHRNRLLKGNSPYIATFQERLKALEGKLVETTVYDVAKQLIASEVAALEAEQTAEDESDTVFERALAHLQYLDGYWMSKELWASWSDFARLGAARLMNRSPESIFMTTNHLESFNNVLKNNRLAHQQRGGRRLRLDVLIHFLILDMLPSIFETRRLQRDEDNRMKRWILTLPGGQQLLNSTSLGKASKQIQVAFLTFDPIRDAGAASLLESRQLGAPEFDAATGVFTFVCYSSLATENDTAPTSYTITISVQGTADCTCPDFRKRGGACKHLRAAVMRLDQLRSPQCPIPTIPIPTSATAAQELMSRLSKSSFDSSSNPVVQATEILTEYLSKDCDASVPADDELLHPDNLAESETGTCPPSSTAGVVDGEDRGEFDLTILHHSSRRALDYQTLACAMKELNPASATIAKIASVLSESASAMSTDFLPDMDVVEGHLHLLLDQFERLRRAVTDKQHPPAVSNNVPFHTSPTAAANSVLGKRRRADDKVAHKVILAPSPEKKQKRHDSYSIH